MQPDCHGADEAIKFFCRLRVPGSWQLCRERFACLYIMNIVYTVFLEKKTVYQEGKRGDGGTEEEAILTPPWEHANLRSIKLKETQKGGLLAQLVEQLTLNQ